MGMFDDVRTPVIVTCPKCGHKTDRFQSKDGPCGLLTIRNLRRVNRFYTSCNGCRAWIEFSRTDPLEETERVSEPEEMGEFTMTVTRGGNDDGR